MTNITQENDKCDLLFMHKLFTNMESRDLGFFFSTYSPTLIISCASDFRHSDMYKVVSHCGSNLHLPDDYSVIIKLVA